MFNTKHNECVGFESRWKVKKVALGNSSQTSEFETRDMETSTSESNSMEVQTDPETFQDAVVDEAKLSAWLTRIYPQVSKELIECAQIRAFRGYYLSTDSNDLSCKLTQSVNVASEVKDGQIGSYVSALSWNSTNQTLAVSCVYKHTVWCYHEGFVGFYTLNRDDHLPETPRLKVSTDSCIMVLAFHTTLPAIIAGGLYTGGVIIWDIQGEREEIIARINGHENIVTQLSWIPDIPIAKTILLASSSLDGHVTLWSFNHTERTLCIKEKHQIKSKLFPEATEKAVEKVIRGVVCFDFSKHSPDIFIVGAEGGMIVQCSVLGSFQLAGSTAEVPIVDSAFKYYAPHKGEITSVSFSPNRNDMFMSNGTDSEIRIYMIGQEEAAKIIFYKNPIHCTTWIPYEEKIIAACGCNGIEIFKLTSGKAFEKNSQETKARPELFTTMQINQNKTNIVAVGTENGRLLMWRVPWVVIARQSF